MPNLNLNSGAPVTANWTTADGFNPTAGETLAVGSAIFEWDGIGSNINVPLGIDLEASLTNLESAFWAEVDAGRLLGVGCSCTPHSFFVWPLPADFSDENIADPGGTLPPLACSNLLDYWYTVPASVGGGRWARGRLVVTAEMLARPAFVVMTPFFPTSGVFQWYDGAGSMNMAKTTTDLVLFNPGGGPAFIILPSGGSPAQPGDVFAWIAFE